eukprot:8958642-Pyramimonas_sp.AAC.1
MGGGSGGLAAASAEGPWAASCSSAPAAPRGITPARLSITTFKKNKKQAWTARELQGSTRSFATSSPGPPTCTPHAPRAASNPEAEASSHATAAKAMS